MIKRNVVFVIVVCMWAWGHVHAANIEAGKAKAEDLCADCHGDSGKGDKDNPPVAGMAIDKFVQAMKEYQNGTRTKSRKMTKAANKVSDEELADLAAYYATLK